MLTVLAAYWPWLAIASVVLACTAAVERRA